ncbi:DUF6221 family protein [Streptomyces rubiginosohelvolus]|uniref:DUF6221 family protein n=1 Tax=Streptomyces rubiginosohelvolus TaxID=67362 RepID=UPI00364FA410
MTDALVAFLKARLDDDAATIPDGVLDWHSPGTRVVVAEGFDKYDVYDSSLKDLLERDDSLMPFGCVAITDYDADAKYIARQDPARTLREVEAARAVIGLYEEAGNRMDRAMDDGDTGAYQEARIEQRTLRKVLLREAAVHKAHPDYLEEWRP